MADADNWELVSLTASTYAAAPGPISPLLLDAHKTGELPNPPPPPAIFMSQHFNWPEAAKARVDLNRCKEESAPAADVEVMPEDDTHCPESCESQQLDDSLTRSDSDFWSNTLGDGDFSLAGEEKQTEIFCAADAAGAAPDICSASGPHVSAAAAALTVGIVEETASHVPVAVSAPRIAPKIPREAAEAWWKKTFSFLRSNARESLTFRFIFVAATVVGLAILGPREKLQQLRLEFNVHSEKISCGSVGEPLGQLKGGMVVGGSPVAHG